MKKHSGQQIVAKLRRVDVELGKGLKVPEVCKQLGINEQTCCRCPGRLATTKRGLGPRAVTSVLTITRRSKQHAQVHGHNSARWGKPTP